MGYDILWGYLLDPELILRVRKPLHDHCYVGGAQAEPIHEKFHKTPPGYIILSFPFSYNVAIVLSKTPLSKISLNSFRLLHTSLVLVVCSIIFKFLMSSILSSSRPAASAGRCESSSRPRVTAASMPLRRAVRFSESYQYGAH